jgi:AcrR family transcriptional regulator
MTGSSDGREGGAPSTPRATPERRGPGRPRDPELERKVLLATVDVFGERGWVGLSFEEIALRSQVGKSSIYLRWKSKESLLGDALRGIQLSPSEATPEGGDVRESRDGGEDVPAPEPSLRDYLVAHAMHRALLYLGPYGLALLRLYVETFAHPEIFAEIREKALTSFVLVERHRVDAAIRNAELPPSASPVQLLDAVEGAVFMHILVTPPALRPRMRAALRGYVEQLVDNQLRAAGYRGRLPSPGSVPEETLPTERTADR